MRRLADRVNDRLTTDMINARDGAFMNPSTCYSSPSGSARRSSLLPSGRRSGFVRVLNAHELGFRPTTATGCS
jgi:hypothetical protein